MEKWFMYAKKANFALWSQKYGISQMMARIIRNRDITGEEDVRKFLYGTLEDCYSPWLLLGMEQAVEGILGAIRQNQRIRVIGDYDVDGICSSYILTKGLSVLGAQVDTAIPHRIHDGYGLNENLIREAKEDGVEWIVTCDNGIAAYEQIALAGQLGIRVIVTDHHEVPFRMEGEQKVELLPPAYAVVDPKQARDTYPFPGICGGVVAYKVILALQERTGDPQLLQTAEELLEFAAFATVCDVMELRDENRILVKEGLKRLRCTQNQGLGALMDVNGIEREALTGYHLGFVLGPCLNATGRLDTARRALELLQSESKAQAMTAAAELKELNDSRKNLTLEGVALAEAYVRENHREQDPVLVVYLPKVHESLAGIIAGRLREKYNKPVFLLTKGEDGVKGSGRSIEAYPMYEKMTQVKHFFSRFGGHRLAAGLSMQERDIEAFRQALLDNCGLKEEDFIPRVHIDMALPLPYATMEFARELSALEPFGTGNPKPLFAQKDLEFLSAFLMGKNKTAARFVVRPPEGGRYTLVYFGDVEKFFAFLQEKYGEESRQALLDGKGAYAASVVYQIGLNTYQGRTQVQCTMLYFC